MKTKETEIILSPGIYFYSGELRDSQSVVICTFEDFIELYDPVNVSLFIQHLKQAKLKRAQTEAKKIKRLIGDNTGVRILSFNKI